MDLTSFGLFLGWLIANQWLIAIIIMWSLVWKGIALWRASRTNELIWFIALFLINTAGILEIVYLLFFAKERED